jgi:hypothetical protein
LSEVKIAFAVIISIFILGCETGRYRYDKLADRKGSRITIDEFRCQEASQEGCLRQLKREMRTQGEDMCGILDHTVSNCRIQRSIAACDVRCVTSSERSGKKAKSKELDAEGFDEFEEGF